MTVKHKLTMDLAGTYAGKRIDMVEGEQYVRELELSLTCDGAPWTAPEDVHAVIRFQKSDGTGGVYDTLEDGTKAWQVSGSKLTVAIAAQVLACAGPVKLSVDLLREDSRLRTFVILLNVKQAIDEDLPSRDYQLMDGFLRIPEKAEVGQYFRVANVNDRGKVTQLEAITLPSLQEAVDAALLQAKNTGEFDGESAYEVALRNGFEGTEEEWLESLECEFNGKSELGSIQQVNVTGSFTTDPSAHVHFHNSRLQGVKPPAVDTDAANKAYVDTACASYVIPAQQQEAVGSLAQAVCQAQDEGGIDCMSFVYLSDCHFDGNSDSDLGELAAGLMDKCAMPYALVCGDVSAEAADRETAQQNLRNAASLLSAIGSERLLQVQGEADGSWNGGQLSSEELYGSLFRRSSAAVHRVTGGDGSYGYVDYPAGKLRFILLNSCRTEAGVLRKNNPGYGNAQLSWLAATALTFEEAGWSVILAAHIPSVLGYELTVRDDAVLQGILHAYRWGLSYTGSSGTAGQWDYVSVSCDYTAAYRAQIVGFFGGHIHQDAIVTDELPYAVVTVAPQMLDCVTVNTKEKVVTLNRLNSGQVRRFSYGTASNILYSVSAELHNCTSDNSAVLVKELNGYQAQITAHEGYSLTNIAVTMGGEDITDTCCSDGMITVSSVTGDIRITAFAG